MMEIVFIALAAGIFTGFSTIVVTYFLWSIYCLWYDDH